MIDQPKKLAFFLPNTFTALNLACGFASIIMSWNGQFYNASMILLLGAIFDSVDGRVARMTGTQSQFGEQFDSISDVVSFGMAPAFLVYNCFFKELGRLGMVISFIYLLCGALRLARFNANIEKVSSDYFQGLPIPTAALGLVGYVLLSLEFSTIRDLTPITAIYVVLYSILMISNIPFYSFKNSSWVKTHKKRVLAIIFLVLAAIFTYEQLMIGVLIGAYVIGGLIYFITHKGALEDVFLWKNENENEEDS
ncbi:CDP-diacylglycerol--serine O-phosphatidyltransferase [Halobacteriovorax sp. HLS]|uniref:CDP-diacylglycerol--serine O-phosphatidyltransferase n=1 Tax=Halobacteriovorax sp. HLS TaxID=2234000 RepID=UPI000FDCC3E3|nr:CDP-diacylglycerol--serine O-phosphatidyltransferase [Halobacteriovorax sp. HLS]